MFRLMDAQLPQPEVIVLDPGWLVKAQIVERGRSYEQDMPRVIWKVWAGYKEHYKFHRGSRVLVDTSEIDFVNEGDYQKLLSCILTPRKPGVYHIKP